MARTPPPARTASPAPGPTEPMLPSPAPGVLFQALPDGAVLLDTRSEVYFGLNAVGARVWQLLPGSRSLDELSAAVLGFVLWRGFVYLRDSTDPKWVIAFGTCASCGGFYDNYTTLPGIDKVIPVDVFIPGCPPRPEAVLDAFLAEGFRVQRHEEMADVHADRLLGVLGIGVLSHLLIAFLRMRAPRSLRRHIPSPHPQAVHSPSG